MAAGCTACTVGVRLLLRNRQLAWVICAAGLQQASNAVVETFALSTLRGTLWGNHMSEYTAASMILFSVIAIFWGGPFGRFSDQIDRRVACAINGAVSFAPAWLMIPFMAMGMPTVALWSSTVAKVVGAFSVSSNVLLALVNDVTDAEDREVAIGVFYAGTNVMMLLLNGFPVMVILVLRLMPGGAVKALLYQAILSAGFFLCLRMVKLPESHTASRATSSISTPTSSNTGGAGADLEQGVRPTWSRASTSLSREGVETDRTTLRALVLEPLHLAFGHTRLRRLFLAAFLISFSGDLVMDIGGQFFNNSLGLLPFGSERQFQMLAALTMIPGALLVIPGYMITGHLAKAGGTLKLLQRLIPCTVFFTVTGATLVLVPQHLRWYFIPFIVICQNYASLVNVPLLRMVGGVAPPGRVGEALAAVGVASQAANLVGNGVVVVVNPLLMRLPFKSVLWMYYPACAGIALLALIPVCFTPKGGWGAASGRTEDVVFAHTMAAIAAKRWQRQVQTHRPTPEPEDLNSEASSTSGNPRTSDTSSSTEATSRSDEDNRAGPVLLGAPPIHASGGNEDDAKVLSVEV